MPLELAIFKPNQTKPVSTAVVVRMRDLRAISITAYTTQLNGPLFVEGTAVVRPIRKRY